MIPARWTPVLVPFVMTFFMTFFVSLMLTFNSVGLIPGFLDLWLHNWALARGFAFPAAIVALPLARRIVGRLTG